jgi:ABC-2 type transport system ATP-binding protein
VIEVDDLHKAYRETVAVAGLSFHVEPGQVLGLVGPNGAGKTTTLRSIAGIIAPTRGRIRVAGHDLASEPIAAKRRLAYVPDDPRLFDALTVWEHLELIASMYGVESFEPAAEELLRLLELDEKRNVLAKELSRGMRQKVAIACAYLHAPGAVLFDEPLTGLDPKGIRTMKDSVVARARDGVALIVSSHLLALVEDICTHLLIVHRGRRLFFGRVDEAKAAFSDAGSDASLEEVFFRATESQDA